MKKAVSRKTTYDIRGDLLRGLVVVFVSLLFGVLLLLWNAESLIKNGMPSILGYGFSVVLSGSMEPALSVDDLVIVRETQEVAVGDVVVYEKGGSLIIHRVVSVDGDTLITQGDANDVADDSIDLSTVQGKMVGRIPAAGGVIRAVKAPVAAVAARFRSGDEASGSAHAAAWVVETVEAEDAKTDLSLTNPGTVSYPFTVKNYRKKTGNTVAVCEVAVRYQIVVELPETETQIKVKLKLKRDGLNLPETELAAGKSCTFYDNSFSFAALEPETHKFTLEISDASIASGSQAVLNGIQVRVEAFQTD